MNVVLTSADRVVLKSLQDTIDGLAEYMGPGYEIVLHSLENLDRSAIKVVNGHYSARMEGAPITDLALKMLKQIEESEHFPHLIYFNQSKAGVPIRSTTIPVLGEHKRVIGLLCINFHMDLSFHRFLESFFQHDTHSDFVTENFAGNTDELIVSALEEARQHVMKDASISTINKNKAIVALLHQKGIFSFKDAVVQVAGLLGISKNTVYLHLRNLGTNSKGFLEQSNEHKTEAER